MNKKVIIACMAGIVCVLLTGSLFFSSCTNEEDSFVISKERNERYADALLSLQDTHHAFLRSLNSHYATRAGVEEWGEGSMTDSTWIDECWEAFEEELESLCMEFDLSGDLSASELEALTLTEEMIDTMMLDNEIFMQFIEENGSPRFYEILSSSIGENCLYDSEGIVVTASDIVSDNNLRDYEKLSLILISDGEVYIDLENTGFDNQTTMAECVANFQEDIQDCNLVYNAGMVITSIVAIFAPPAAVGVAAGVGYDYVKCAYFAIRNASRCLKSITNSQ